MEKKEEFCKNLSWELGREITWEDIINEVGEDESIEVLKGDVRAIIQVRGAFGLAPFC